MGGKASSNFYPCQCIFFSRYLRILKVMVGEPLHSVERREMVVETDWEDFPPESEGAPGPPGVPDHKHYQKKFIFSV